MTTPLTELALAANASQQSAYYIDKMGIYSVKSYSAEGDGATDDYTAIYNAVTAANSDGGGIVFFPVGTYVIESNLTIPSGVTLWFADGAKIRPNNKTITGASTKITAGLHQIFDCTNGITFAGTWILPEIPSEWFGTLTNTTWAYIYSLALLASKNVVIADGVHDVNLTVNGGTSYLVGFSIKSRCRDSAQIKPTSGTCLSIIRAEEVTIENLYLNGQSGATIGLAVGNGSYYCSYLDVRNVTIRNCSTYGIQLFDSEKSVFTNLAVEANGYGLYVDDGNVATLNNFINCSFRTSTNRGVYLRSGSSYKFQSCTFESNTKIGVYIYGKNTYLGSNTGVSSIENCWFEANGSESIDSSSVIHLVFDNYAQNWRVTNCFFGSPWDASTDISNDVGLAKQVHFKVASNILLEQCSFYGRCLAKAVSVSASGAVFNCIIKDHLNPTLADRNMFTFENAGSGVIVDYKMRQYVSTSGVTGRQIHYTNISRIDAIYSDGGTTPSDGTYLNGDKLWTTDADATEYIGQVCTAYGTFGTLAGVTASASASSTIATLNNVSALKVGDWVSISGATGYYQIWFIDTTNKKCLLNTGISHTVSGASVAFKAPSFKGFGVIQS